MDPSKSKTSLSKTSAPASIEPTVPEVVRSLSAAVGGVHAAAARAGEVDRGASESSELVFAA